MVFKALLKISFYIFSSVARVLAFEVFEVVWFVKVVEEVLG
jgi:hypothetical protein